MYTFSPNLPGPCACAPKAWGQHSSLCLRFDVQRCISRCQNSSSLSQLSSQQEMRGLLRAMERHLSWDPWPSPEQVLPRFRISLKGKGLTLCRPKQDKAEVPKHYLYFSVSMEAMFLLETSSWQLCSKSDLAVTFPLKCLAISFKCNKLYIQPGTLLLSK